MANPPSTSVEQLFSATMLLVQVYLITGWYSLDWQPQLIFTCQLITDGPTAVLGAP